MSSRWLFAGVGVMAVALGLALWRGHLPVGPVATDLGPGALFAATFTDTDGRPRSLGQYEGKVLVLNFWATWCAPCREEMPAFARLQSQWAGRNVQFVGLSNEDPRRVERFGKDLAINYPLLVGSDEVGEMSRRLGNTGGGLPYTVIFDPQGHVATSKVGPYTEDLLKSELAALTAKSP